MRWAVAWEKRQSVSPAFIPEAWAATQYHVRRRTEQQEAAAPVAELETEIAASETVADFKRGYPSDPLPERRNQRERRQTLGTAANIRSGRWSLYGRLWRRAEKAASAMDWGMHDWLNTMRPPTKNAFGIHLHRQQAPRQHDENFIGTDSLARKVG